MANNISTGSLTVGTSAVQITTIADPRCRVSVTAATANTANIYIGTSTVTANAAAATDGFELAPGQGRFYEIGDASRLYARSTASSQKLFFEIIY